MRQKLSQHVKHILVKLIYSVIYKDKLSTTIIFKRCKFNVNLWTFVGFVLQNVPKSYKLKTG